MKKCHREEKEGRQSRLGASNCNERIKEGKAELDELVLKEEKFREGEGA